MEAVLEVLESIVEAIDMVWELGLEFVDSMITFGKVLADAAVSLPQVFDMMPTPAVAISATVLTVALLYKVLGREG